MEWFPWYPNDFRRKTYHLSLAEDGAYRRLIDEYMIAREALPNDDTALARILGIAKEEWDAIAPHVRPFFRERNGRLFHTRCEEELRAQEFRHNRNSERAKKAAFARYSKTNGLVATRNANSMLAPATLHKKSTTTSSETVTKPQAVREGTSGASVFLQNAMKQKGWAAPAQDDDPMEIPAYLRRTP